MVLIYKYEKLDNVRVCPQARLGLADRTQPVSGGAL